MKPITRKEYYLAKTAGTYTGPTPPPVLREDYYLATLSGDYSGNCPAPVTRLEKYMSAAAGLTTYVPQPVTRVEMYWYAIAKGAGYVPEPVTREEQLLYAIIHKEPQYIDKTAEGSTILLTDSAEAPFTALTVYGHSTQDGTPSPENPVPIVSAGDNGEINVSVSDNGTQSQTLTLSTPGGLPGIPVDSGGNYTDENGQQWVCDEVDFERGVYVQRINKKILTSDLSWSFRLTTGKGNNNFQIRLTSEEGATDIPGGKPTNSMCNFLKYAGLVWDDNEINLPKIYASVLEITASFPPDSEVNSLQKWNELLDGIGNCYIYYILDIPIETPLSSEQISAYKALHTYSPTTTVSNDAAAWMKVGYKANP